VSVGSGGGHTITKLLSIRFAKERPIPSVDSSGGKQSVPMGITQSRRRQSNWTASQSLSPHTADPVFAMHKIPPFGSGICKDIVMVCR